MSQGVYEGQRAEEVAVTQPRHFPHSELKISLKSLFQQQTPPEDVLSPVLSQFLRQVDDMGNV